jgi:hypothetical protein
MQYTVAAMITVGCIIRPAWIGCVIADSVNPVR